ncbi:MAG: S8 family serine peptidase [Candidatus Delongbacteria bacterium]|nr:S8 family serine peptidase [Candidatus Delongbacteria bacterium]
MKTGCFLILLIILGFYSSTRADASCPSCREDKLDYPLRLLLNDRDAFNRMIQQRRAEAMAGSVDPVTLNKLAYTPPTDSFDILNVLVECEAGREEPVMSYIYSLGGIVNTRLNELMTVRIKPSHNLEALSRHSGIRSIRLGTPFIFDCNRMVQKTNILQVWAGTPPLPQSFTGKGVILGFLDTGIQYYLEDFINPDGTSRILRIWDQTDDLHQKPENFSYGSQWTQDEINDEIDGDPAGKIEREFDNPAFFHGTASTNIAAGNGRTTDGWLKGCAPEADIVMVKNGGNYDYCYSGLANIIDAVNYIFSLADSLNRPCVINLPLGINGVCGYGNSPEERALRYLLEARSGRVICAAAGNSNESYSHIVVMPDTIAHGSYLSDLAYDCLVYIRDDDRDHIAIRIGLDSSYFYHGDEYLFENRYVLPDRAIPKDSTPWMTVNDLVAAGSHWEDTLIFTGPILPSALSASSGAILAGDCREKARCQSGLNYPESPAVTQSIPIRIDLERYGDDWNIWMSNLWLSREAGPNSDNLYAWGMFRIMMKKLSPVSVQPIHAWGLNISGMDKYPWMIDSSHCPTYINPDNDYQVVFPGCVPEVITTGCYVNKGESDEYPVDDLASYSSHGPILTGAVKPEIATPGHAVSYSKFNTSSSGVVQITFTGTSSAVAITSGICALYLEKYPEADFRQVREAMFHSARSDHYTGTDLPNNRWGYGKIDAFAMLNYGSSPVMETSTADREPFRLITTYPNPSRGAVNFKGECLQPGTAEVVIFDLLGRCRRTLSTTAPSAGSVIFRWDGLDHSGNAVPSGLYLYRIEWNRQTIHNGKLIMLQ